MIKADKNRLDKIAQMGCYCCGRPAEVHHIRSHTGFSLRPNHQQTIPLCPSHHRTGKDSIHLGKNLLLKQYSYPKGKNTNYNWDFKPETQGLLF